MLFSKEAKQDAFVLIARVRLDWVAAETEGRETGEERRRGAKGQRYGLVLWGPRSGVS